MSSLTDWHPPYWTGSFKYYRTSEVARPSLSSSSMSKRAHDIADDIVVLSYGRVAMAGPAASLSLADIEGAYELNAQSA